MTLSKCSWLICLALVAASSLPAAEITGKVRDASGDAATVVIEGDTAPAVGDSAEIYFKVPGADEEISVASGKVTAVEAKVVKIKIEKTTGTIEKDQLARIKSGSTPTTAGASPSPAASLSPVASPSPMAPSILGDWVGDAGRDGTISLSFKADGTLLWMVQDEKEVMSTLAKYRLNPSAKPQSIEAFDFEEGPLKGGRLYGSFELQSDGRLKLEFDDKESPKEFTKDAVVFSKATSPIVLPNKPADTSPKPKTPDASPSGTAATGTLIAGDWTSTAPGGEIVSFSFKEDGTLLFVTENPETARSASGKYRLDPATKPQGIELFDFEEGSDLSGERLRGIFELQSDGRLKLDFQKDPKAPPLKEFSKEALVFSKATSPVVRPTKPKPTPYVAPTPKPDEKLVDEGNELYRRKEYDGAIKLYTKAIELNPKNASAFFWRGNCFFDKNDKSAAIADYEKALELDPTMKLKTLIDTMKENQSVDGKLSASPTPGTSKLAPATTPDEALVAAAIQLYERGADAAAMEALEKAIALNPKNARAYHYRGLCFHRKKEWTPALADFQKAMKLDPSIDLEDLIHETRVARLAESELTASPTPAEPTATPARSRKKSKLKP